MPPILVVDDEPEIVDLLPEFLTLKGYEVATATGSPEAFLAIRPPRMSGCEALRQLRTTNQEVG